MDLLWGNKQIDDCFHVCSDGTGTFVLFETEEDKIFGLNQLAITAYKFGLTVLCPVVMDTHFHVILRGEKDRVAQFKAEIARILSCYLRRTEKQTTIDVHIFPIQDERELKAQIIYVFRNPLEAGYPFLPENYRWGAGRVYFQITEEKGILLANLSVRRIRELFHTRIKLPKSWKTDDKGMLLPSTYIDRDFVHRLFGTPRAFLAFLYVRKKDQAELDARCALPFAEKKEENQLRKSAEKTAESLFKKRIIKLSTSERIILAKNLWQNNLTFSKKQLARIVRLDSSLVESVF